MLSILCTLEERGASWQWRLYGSWMLQLLKCNQISSRAEGAGSPFVRVLFITNDARVCDVQNERYSILYMMLIL